MSEASLTPIIKALEKYFDLLNQKYFESALSKPLITLLDGQKNKAYGWITTKPQWQEKKGGEYIELNISCDYLDRNYTDVLGTLHHEMIHIYNLQNNVQDCSRSGNYHNRNFDIACRQHGLETEKIPQIGYRHIIPDDTKKYYESIRQKTDITAYFRKRKSVGESKKSSTRKYKCPCCSQTVRATKEVNIICGICKKEMVLA